MENERVQMKMTVEVVMSVGKEVFELDDEEFDAVDALLDESITVDSVTMIEATIIGLDGEAHDFEIDSEDFKEYMMEFVKDINERA